MSTHVGTVVSMSSWHGPIGSGTIDGVMALCLVLCVSAIAAPVYSRWFVHGQLWWDDCKLLHKPCHGHVSQVITNSII